ncbi:tetratricopeptide repeat protein [Nonomuraea sp. B12E4]|uniref:tetratricopeptide repeat protein n=1 Tax=Nonomuraea sp. B12E4 TaxID=3153564 RepID=UPI00325F4A4B
MAPTKVRPASPDDTGASRSPGRPTSNRTPTGDSASPLARSRTARDRQVPPPAGRISEAIDAHNRSIALLEEAGAAADGVTALGNLAEAYRLGGEYEQAMACHRRALRTLRDNGQFGGYPTAEISWGLGLALHETGELAEARGHWRESVAILHSLGLITAEDRRAIDTSAIPATPGVIRRHT